MSKPKVYFACLISGGREDADFYGQIIDLLHNYSQVLSEIFAIKKLSAMVEGSPSLTLVEYQELSTVEQAIQKFLASLQPLSVRAA